MNLPFLLTSFVGRKRELSEITRLLSLNRMLTLTGPPGCGKTRLAIETGRVMVDRFPDGVWLVDLAQINNPDLIVKATAQAFDIAELGVTPIETLLLDYLKKRELLIIMDNCEHVVHMAASLCLTLLSNCPTIKILATSQMPLDIPGEQEWLIPSLPLPDLDEPFPGQEMLLTYDAVRLFVERARYILPDFQLTFENAPIVVEICRRLDGIPLAIELAAARVKLLSVKQIASRLDARFELLSAPRRLVTSRHQTLQAAIDWSFHLLTPDEQVLLTRMAVFPGAYEMEAAEAVCGFSESSPLRMIELIGSLVDRSLIMVSHQEGSESRYRLLESVRLYGLARLSADELNQLKDRHLNYYALLAQEADRHDFGEEQIEWLDRLETEMINFRAAMNWASTGGNVSCVLTGLKMAGGLARFCCIRSYHWEGALWLEKALELAETAGSQEWVQARAYAHFRLAELYYLHSRLDLSKQHAELSRRMWKQLGEAGSVGYAWSTGHLARVLMVKKGALPPFLDLIQASREIFESTHTSRGVAFVDFLEANFVELLKGCEPAEPFYLRALSTFLAIGDTVFAGYTCSAFSDCLMKLSRYEDALFYGTQGLDLFEQVGYQIYTVIGLMDVCTANIALNHLETAEMQISQADKLQEKLGLPWLKSNILTHRGIVFLLTSKYQEASRVLLVVAHIDDQRKFPNYLSVISMLYAAALALDDPARAARIIGYIQHRQATGPTARINQTNLQSLVDARIAAARQLLGSNRFEQALNDGASCAFDQLFYSQPAESNSSSESIASGRAITPSLTSPTTLLKGEKQRYSGLTGRERDIVVLVAKGLSNREISTTLTLSERTVTTHMTNILSKLGFSSRTQIAAWAVEKGLAKAS